MKSPKIFKHYSDAGHGWVAVNIKLIHSLNLVDKISSCSYINGGTAYLEEDCDAGVFIEAYELKHGVDSYKVISVPQTRDLSNIRYHYHYTKFRAIESYNHLMRKHRAKESSIIID